MADDSIFAGPAEKIPASDDSMFAGPAEAIKTEHPKVTGLFGSKESEFEHDILRGVGESVTGIGELIPGLHGPAAAASKYLHEGVKHPYAETTGEFLPFVAGGEFLGAGKAASLVPEGAGVLSRIGSKLARGAVGGGVAGAEAGGAAPTGEQDYDKMLATKAHGALTGGIGGALVGGGLGGLGGIGKEVLVGGKKLIDVATGKPVKEAMGRLQGEAVVKGSEVVSEKGAQAEAAAKKVAETEPRYHQEIEKAEAAKGAAGDAEANAERLADEFKKKPSMTAVQFGDRVRKLASDTFNKRVKTRAKISNIGGAKAAAGEGDIVDTSKMKSYLDQWDSETTDPNEKSIIAYVRDAIGGEKPGPINVEKAESTRTTLGDLENARDMRAIGKGEGKPAKAAHRIGVVKGLLQDAIREGAPQVSQAVGRFRQLSRPLDPFQRTGPLAGAVKTDVFSDDYIVDQGRLVESLLAKTKEGSNPFELLVQEDPKLKGDMRKYLQSKLFGEPHLNKNITPQQFDNFVRDNNRVLRQTGLFREFVGVRNKMFSAEEKSAQAKLMADIKAGDAEAVRKELASAESDKEISTKTRIAYDKLLSEVNAASKAGDVSALSDKTGSIFKKLFDDERISKDELDRTLDMLADLKAKNIDRQKKVKMLTQAALVALLVGGMSEGWKLYHLGRVFIGL